MSRNQREIEDYIKIYNDYRFKRCDQIFSEAKFNNQLFMFASDKIGKELNKQKPSPQPSKLGDIYKTLTNKNNLTKLSFTFMIFTLLIVFTNYHFYKKRDGINFAK